ncbi:zf-TFIIB domain-containing protein [Malaciobacter mytili]|uniref:Transcription factor zinc-finger domain-containing protein n=1 Tax=Malaciobacter mytili LMG 24559 TaxID=1032238 RepID=A0AAX2AJE7_9BACT|nr:zf-TFIIB domain-containing protein [Malaciobacter mytili]AXH14127.1 putative transcriptional regulator (zinc finger domain) [Malaciobacter mytili LMG 24559]RXI46687.1 hypothetical protein CRU99_02875 [Malaciobacter mytili]RXK17003.1 hypothetical protein CP985_00870 [Malaciobacter mytili LMG 24559]
MKCPICKDIDLVISERQSVEIDYCPSCRGVWLDRGELDKIIQRSSVSSSQYNDYRNSSSSKYDSYKHKQNGNYKRKSFLSELFDF